MKVKRIVGMIDNWGKFVVAELDNGLYAIVPTFSDGEVEKYVPAPNYSYSFLPYAKGGALIANGYVTPDCFGVAMANFNKMFEKCPLNKDMEKYYLELRKSPGVAREEKKAEKYSSKKFPPGDESFFKELQEIFKNGPVDPKDYAVDEKELEELSRKG